jgi:hypothetical protein
MECWNDGIMGNMTKDKFVILKLNRASHHSSISLFDYPAGENSYGV